MLRNLLIITGLTLFLFSCGPEVKQETDNSMNPGLHKVVVKEVIQTDAYTYLRVAEGTNENWLAVSHMEVEVEGTYYYNDALEMKHFTSKDLDRTFERIYFVQELSTTPISKGAHAGGMQGGMHGSPHGGMQGSPHGGGGQRPNIEKKDVKIEPLEGGVNIGTLYASPEQYGQKTIRVKGLVVKVNTEIMGKNWAHIQDGTDGNGKFDLTVTTKEDVKVGDVVIFEGKISLKKDFGAGYFYDVIMEDAKMLKTKI